MHQRQNPHRSRRSSRYFRRSHHGDGAVGGHAVEVGHIGQKIEPVLQGILSRRQTILADPRSRSAVSIPSPRALRPSARKRAASSEYPGKCIAALSIGIAVASDGVPARAPSCAGASRSRPGGSVRWPAPSVRCPARKFHSRDCSCAGADIEDHQRPDQAAGRNLVNRPLAGPKSRGSINAGRKLF